VLDELRRHTYHPTDKGSRPDDPGWHACSCGWEGYWCDWQPHVAGAIVDALPLLDAAERLAWSVADEVTRCELTADDGMDRCPGKPVAIRYEHGFLDTVCRKHAERAEQRRGATVIWGYAGV